MTATARPERLHFVFLQGMPSPFFSRIGRELAARGCRVTGINLCFGDQLFWHGGDTVNYRGTLADWPDFIGRFLGREQVTDLVLLGEQRSYHKPAVEVAKALGVRVTVTDFGYLRPDWITLERDGMSGNSRFPRDTDTLRELAAAAPRPDFTRRYADSAFTMSVNDLVYSFANVLFFWLYPHYRRSDRRPHPLLYFPATGLRLARAAWSAARAQQQVKAIAGGTARYFLLPLQLEHDFQIVAYSPFDHLADAVQLIIQSFARHAGADTRLVVKIHPWDPGFVNWNKRVLAMAAACGAAQRIDYLDGGSLDELTARSAGVVTVNSTSGLRALQLGVPVKTLGQAIYDVPGLTHQGDLDSFWQAPAQPDAALTEAFINAMAACIQIRGVFFSEPGLGAAVNEASERLYRGTVGAVDTALEQSSGTAVARG